MKESSGEEVILVLTVWLSILVMEVEGIEVCSVSEVGGEDYNITVNTSSQRRRNSFHTSKQFG